MIFRFYFFKFPNLRALFQKPTVFSMVPSKLAKPLPELSPQWNRSIAHEILLQVSKVPPYSP